jgi:hypothetical protein
MKTRTRLVLLAVTAAALSLHLATTSGQVFDSVESLNNRAVGASPRANEMFPWLARTSVTAAKRSAAEASPSRATAASPRILEEFPELSRLTQTAKSGGSFVRDSAIMNRAVAASPRAKEEFPWLLRGNYELNKPAFEIAPLK